MQGDPGAAHEDRVFLGVSRGICRTCRADREVRTVSDSSGVYLEGICPEHGKSRAQVAETLAWYLRAVQSPALGRPPDRFVLPRTEACAGSCGPCTFHAQRCHLPVFSITNACELRCPICFTYNRADQLYFMTEEELDRQLDFVLAATGNVDLINITGGEPTQHPRLFELLVRAQRPGIGRITMNTNGLRLARDPEMARRLADLGVYVILSLDTLRSEVSCRIHGRDICDDKKKALENLERFGVPTTILTVLVGEVNEPDLEPIVDLGLKADFVRSLTIQTMAYTGQGGGAFGPRRHICVEGAERRLAAASSGRVKVSDFMPLPTAHPLCYGVAYYLIGERDALHSLLHFTDPPSLAKWLADGYLLHPTEEMHETIRRSIERLWAEGGHDALLASMKRMLATIYPPGQVMSVHERQSRAERMIKTIYVHAHMDEDTFEIGRAMRCPDQVPVHAERLIGACSYNLFYRQKDERFWVKP